MMNSDSQVFPKIADTVKELNKQEIFYQIDRDILSQQKNNPKIQQNMKSNYVFVVILDLIAFVIALLGAIVVYRIFKEQQIQLVSGQQGIRILENTLLEEMSKQYGRDLAEKKLELQNIRQQLVDTEKEYNIAIVRINEEARLEIERQRMLLEEELLAQLIGKTTEEEQNIRQAYEQQLRAIEDEINRDRLERENIENERLQQVQEEQAQEDILIQLEEAERKLTISRQQLAEVESSQLLENTPLLYDRGKDQQFNQIITRLFLQIPDHILAGQYNQIALILSEIEKAYNNDMPIGFLLDRKETDLYVVSLIRNSLNNYQNVLTLQNQIVDQQNIITELEQNPQVLTKVTVASNAEITRDLQDFIDNVTNSKSSPRILRQKVNNLDNQIPELLTFAQYYVDFINTTDIDNIRSLEQRGDDFVAKNEYSDAINTYQQILRVYPSYARIDQVVEKLYQAIVLQLNSIQNNALVTEVENDEKIPQNLVNKIQNIVQNPRYTVQEYKIIYMKNPDGYILDVLDKNRLLISLIPGKRVAKNQLLEVFRVSNQDDFKMDKIGSLTTLARGREIIQTINSNYNIRIGDLVYIK